MAVDIEMVGDLKAVDCTCAPQASRAIRASFGAREGGLDQLSSVELYKISVYFYSNFFQIIFTLAGFGYSQHNDCQNNCKIHFKKFY